MLWKPLDAKPPAILLGSDCLTGLQLSRILWRSGVPVIGVADRVDSPYCRTRAVRRTVGRNGLENPEPLLSQIASQYGSRPVILACTDAWATWLNEHRDVVGEQADFLLPPRDVLDLLSNKARFYRYVEDHDLQLPETRLVETPEALTRAAQEMAFPLVLKPPHRTPTWLEASGNEKALRIDSREALLRVAPPLQDAVGTLILQAWVRGPSSLSRELSVCLDDGSQLLAGVVLEKLRQWRPDTGTASLAVQVEDEEVLSTGLEILQNLGYAGAGQMEFKRDAVDGRLYIIEMNAGRAALNFPLCEASGVDLTCTWYAAAAGLPLPDRRTVTRPGAKWICWKRDLAAALAAWRQGQLTLPEWLRSVKGVKWSADFCLDDPMPLLADVVGKTVGWLRRARRPAKD